MKNIIKYLKGIDFMSMGFGFTFALTLLITCNYNVVEVDAFEVEEVTVSECTVEVREIDPVVVSSSGDMIEASVLKRTMEDAVEVAEMGKTREVTTDIISVPNHEEGCKSYNFTYMPYTAVTAKSSAQYQLLNSDECYTDPVSGIRMVEDRYCIALGSGYTHTVGQKVDLIMEDGSIVECILADCKSDAHTDASHKYHSKDGSVAEFVVDYTAFNSSEQWKDFCYGAIKEIRIVE